MTKQAQHSNSRNLWERLKVMGLFVSIVFLIVYSKSLLCFHEQYGSTWPVRSSLLGMQSVEPFLLLRIHAPSPLMWTDWTSVPSCGTGSRKQWKGGCAPMGQHFAGRTWQAKTALLNFSCKAIWLYWWRGVNKVLISKLDIETGTLPRCT